MLSSCAARWMQQDAFLQLWPVRDADAGKTEAAAAAVTSNLEMLSNVHILLLILPNVFFFFFKRMVSDFS